MGPTVETEERVELRSGSQAIERALRVLDCFAGHPELTLSEVAGRARLPVSTTHRIMQALVRGRFLERDGGDTYRIGWHVADLVPRRSTADEVAPYLYALAAGIKITVSFGVIDDGELATVLSARPPVAHCAAQIPSGREPLHATAMGKTLLAFDPDGPGALAKRLGALDRYTARTWTSMADLIADLGQIRRRGFAMSDEERTEGVRAVAVPVFGTDHRPVAAIGVQALSRRMTDDLVRSVVPAMRHFAGEVSRRLSDEPLVGP